MFTSIRRVEPALAEIRRHCTARPRVGLVLGSGLGGLAEQINVEARLDYATIPHFPRSTVPGHRGHWICGTWAGVPVVAMDGRVHAYEGRRAQDVAFGVRLMHAMGVDLLLLVAACGGLNPNYRVGDLVILDDHVNLTFAGPLVGRHDGTAGVKYPDLSRPYDPQSIQRAAAICRQRDIVAHRGVYVGMLGPTYETRAEYRMLRRIGGDVVGMSIVFETIVAVQCHLRVLALGVVTNVCPPDRLQSTQHQQVLDVAGDAGAKLCEIIADVLAHKTAGTPE